MKLLLVLLALTIASVHGRPESSKIDSNVLSSIQQEEPSNVFVTFNEGTEDVCQAIDDTRFNTREERLNALHSALELHAQRVQANVKALIGNRFETIYFWITSQLMVKDPTMEMVLELANHSDVKSLSMEEVLPLELIIEGPVFQRENPEEEWGVKKIQAKYARDLLRNSSTNFVTPIIVSTIDTGARHTHEALRGNWVGEYGWFDPYNANLLPMDANGHGTHTTGTICGSHGVGVYPEARWAACRGCATSSCSQSALLKCAEFITCPTRSDGTGKDCSKAPHLVSNSWGGGRGQTWFDEAIRAFHAAHIVPLFSQGNSGPSCNTANSPGDRHVIGVGSTTIDDTLSSFSSVGPTTDGRMKPDIAAPGSNVVSAYNSGDSDYRALSGTSMACPHTAGAAALLLAYNPNMSFQKVLDFLGEGADTKIVSSGRTCEGRPDHVMPNHHFGKGRLNAFKALQGAVNAAN